MFDSYRKYLINENTQFIQMVVGLLSILIGMFLAGVIIHFVPVDLTSLEKARQLGIIGKTVLDGYPKQLEIKYYITGVVLSIMIGLSTFLAITYYYHIKKGVKSLCQDPIKINDMESQSPSIGILRWVVLILVLYLVTFHREFIYKNWYWGPWAFFFEEGIYLRWINELLQGGILYKDIYLQGGPLMVWPQYLVMKLFKPSIALYRYYSYCGYFLGYIILFVIFYEIVKNRIMILLGMLLIIFYYYPMFPGFQQSLGRFAFSLLPLYFSYKFFHNKKSLYLLISGFTLGLALLSSQELGISSLVAVVAMLTAYFYREGETTQTIICQTSLIIVGMLIPLLPTLGYFAYHKALSGFYESMINMPLYYVLGLGRQFPNILYFINQLEKGPYDTIEILLAYWPIVFYITSVYFFMVLFLRKSFNNKHILMCGIAILGGIIFQRSFGIYSLLKIKNVIYPIIILCIGFLDMAWVRMHYERNKASIHSRIIEVPFHIALFIFITCGLYAYSQPLRGFVPGLPPYKYLSGLIAGYTNRYVPLNIARAENIYMPPEWAKKTKLIVEYVKKNTVPDEPIFVFPHSPMYYFLTDRPSVTKYPVIYAIPKKYREQIIEKLDEGKVKYIIHIDDHRPHMDIMISRRFPKIVDYIKKNYKVEWRYGDTLILKRIGRYIPVRE